MDLLNAEIRDITRKKFESELASKVSLLFFTQEPTVLIVPNRIPGLECQFCRETRQLLEEVKSLSDKIDLQVFDFVAHKEKAAEFGIDKIPATVVLGVKDVGIRFYGIPSGYEYTSLVEAIVDVSKGTTELGPKTKESLRTVGRDVHIQVFVTPTCPYCTAAVRLGHQMAVESHNVRCDMVEATEFPHLAQKYTVYGVPKTVINETVAIDGAVPEEVFLANVLKAAGQENA
ncbi:MAG: thioredoxin family protein [Candidatus Aminicenantales bacterium]|jgi:glutaredoxin-like protein